jgi:DNA-directed RNA polymerase specialized sigma subunit
MRKLAERNRNLYQTYLEQSYLHGATYGDIGKLFNVSASRAWRIVKAESKKYHVRSQADVSNR